MKSAKILVLLASFLCLALTTSSFGADTDLYTGGAGVKPNILLIVDTSTSMARDVDTGNHYDPATVYPTDPNHTDIVPTPNQGKIYQKNGSYWFPLIKFKDTISGVGCPAAQTALSNVGYYFGPPNYNSSTGKCTGTQVTLVTGNWLNFYLASDGIYGSMPKLDIIKLVTTNLLNNIQDVRVGLMRFGSVNKNGVIDSQQNDGIPSVSGRIIYNITDLDDTTRAALVSAINSLSATDDTPLAETLYEAGLYFQGAQSYFNYKNGTRIQYTSPIQYYCQQNYAVLLTDGMPRYDNDPVLSTVVNDRDGDQREPPGAPNAPPYINGGTDFLDDVAKYLYDTDLRTDMQNKQDVLTYTIGFNLVNDEADSYLAPDLLKRTATLGHGQYYDAAHSASLVDAFTSILNDILAKTSSFVAPIVPVSKLDRTVAGNRMYLAFFQPQQIGMWTGNIKKYGVAQSNDSSKGIVTGDVLDASGSKAIGSDGQFYANSQSYWTTLSADGGQVQKGGVGEVLMNRTSARNIYTYMGTKANLTDPSNAFTTTNTSITPSMVGQLTNDNKNILINFVYGFDAYDDNGNGITNEKRNWILGSFVHSRPFVINYGPNPTDRTVIYAGSNDGMLHAFDDNDGSELWAFIPPDLLGRLQELHTNTPGTLVDGAPKAYLSYDANGKVTQAILIFGLRRGGNKYYALDVTDPLNPKYLWKIDPNVPSSPFAEMGQSWSTPEIGKIASGTGEKWVAFIGGGYDTNEDHEPNSPADSTGRAIYVVDVLTGSLVWRYSYGEDPTMTYCIPSDITKLDMNGNGYVDRLYVGDTNGRMWRFDIGNANDTAAWTGRIMFKSNPGASDKRAIFYPPDVTFEKDSNGNYEQLFFGTGDRENPNDTSQIDRLYAVKDRSDGKTLGEADLVDVTPDLLQNGTQDQINANLASLQTLSGWLIKLNTNSGEKCLSTPDVFNKVAYFTTFTPSVNSGNDPCFIGEGTASLYALDYSTGKAVFNLDLTNDVGGPVIQKSDRVVSIGSAIPSGVIITIIGGQATGYTGVGGGVYTPILKSRRSIFPLYWNLIF